MSNDYYNNTTNTLSEGSVAYAADVEAKCTDIASGFDKIPTESQIKRENVNFVDAGGASDVYTVTLTYAPAAYVDGMKFTARIASGTSNTGASTINVNSLGAKSVKRKDGSNPSSGEITAGEVYEFCYDEDNDYFILMDAIATVNVSTGIFDWTDSPISSNTTAAAGKGYACDTSSAGFNLTLPATPSKGDSIGVKDYASTFNTNALVLVRNGEKIMGLEENCNVDIKNISLEVTYIDSTKGWRF